MRNTLQLMTLLVLFLALGAPASFRSGGLAEASPQAKPSCEQNPDALYNRHQVLTSLAEILNNSAPSFRRYEPNGFEVENDKPRRFFIYDLTDLSNKGTPLGSCVQLLNNHVYHVSPIYLPFSFSHILFLDDGQMKVFRSVNCKGGDKIEDVLSYLKPRLSDARKNEILARVKAYRDHGIYATTDEVVVRCDEMKVDHD